MSAFVDGLTRHVLASIDADVRIFPESEYPISAAVGDSEGILLTVEQALELSDTLRRAAFVVSRKDRRSHGRELCVTADCSLARNHVGPHRGACGCLNGCAAWTCPNV